MELDNLPKEITATVEHENSISYEYKGCKIIIESAKSYSYVDIGHPRPKVNCIITIYNKNYYIMPYFDYYSDYNGGKDLSFSNYYLCQKYNSGMFPAIIKVGKPFFKKTTWKYDPGKQINRYKEIIERLIDDFLFNEDKEKSYDADFFNNTQ